MPGGSFKNPRIITGGAWFWSSTENKVSTCVLLWLLGKFDFVTESPRSHCPASPCPSYCVNTRTEDLSSPQPSSDSCPSLLLKTWPSVRWRWRGVKLGLNQVTFEEPQWLAGGIVLLIYGRCKSAFFLLQENFSLCCFSLWHLYAKLCIWNMCNFHSSGKMISGVVTSSKSLPAMQLR